MEGIYVHKWLIRIVVQQKLTQHGKATTLQLEKKKAQIFKKVSVFQVLQSITAVSKDDNMQLHVGFTKKNNKGKEQSRYIGSCWLLC